MTYAITIEIKAPKVHAELEQAQRELESYGLAGSYYRDSLHITLVQFTEEVGNEFEPTIIDIMKQIDFSSIKLQFGAAEQFPADKGGAIHFPVIDAEGRLPALHQSLLSMLAASELNGKYRVHSEFKPHCTLGFRCEPACDEDLSALPIPSTSFAEYLSLSLHETLKGELSVSYPYEHRARPSLSGSSIFSAASSSNSNHQPASYDSCLIL